MKKQRFGLNDEGKRVELELGVEFKPEEWMIYSSIKKLANKYPDIEALNVLVQIAQDEPDGESKLRKVLGWTPFVLQAGFNQNVSEDLAFKCLTWVLVCGWYYYGHGPKPDISRKPRSVSVAASLEWRESLLCPVCNGRYLWYLEGEDSAECKAELEAYHKGEKEVVLRNYAKWLAWHSVRCQKPLARKSALAKLRKEQAADALKRRKSGEHFKALTQLGLVGEEVLKELARLRKENYRLERELEVSGQLASGNQAIQERYEEALRELEERHQRQLLRQVVPLECEVKLSQLKKTLEDVETRLRQLASWVEQRKVLKAKLAELDKVAVTEENELKLAAEKRSVTARLAAVVNSLKGYTTEQETARKVKKDLETKLKAVQKEVDKQHAEQEKALREAGLL